MIYSIMKALNILLNWVQYIKINLNDFRLETIESMMKKMSFILNKKAKISKESIFFS